MNENEIKKAPEAGTPPSENDVKAYNDMDIFDFDAHRKAKMEAEKARTAPRAPTPQNGSGTVPQGAQQPARPPQPTPASAGQQPHQGIPTGIPVQQPMMQQPQRQNMAQQPAMQSQQPAAQSMGQNAGLSAARTVGQPPQQMHPTVGNVPLQTPPEGRIEKGNPRTPTKPRHAAPQPQKRQPVPGMTDIQPDKVVFDASTRKPGEMPKNTKDKKTKPIKPVKEKTKGSHPLALLSKALIYIAIVLLVSGILAYFIISVANDVFAFVKADAQIEVIIPEYATLDQIADELHDKKVIEYPTIFVYYTMLRGNDPGEYKAGVYTVSPSQNYDQLLSTFVVRKSNALTEISVTIPEGYTIDDMIKLFVEEKGMGTREGFIDAIQNGKYDYWFLDNLEVDPNRKYRLEGYLYPDTYYFYKEWPEEKIINKMLQNFYAKFDIKYKQECEKAGMTIDDVVNLASIIQMEAKYPSDYELVSCVIHNRLNSSYYMHRLDCDATIQYALAERKEDLTHEDTLIDHPYNTYKHGGLPPGPISNPTLKAIRAALYPEQKNYYFFVSDIDGKMLYASTLTEHNANIAKVEANAAAAKKAKEENN
ncbi:MAG: endolytic transglycosylase MltG [Clostridia bacterium]|nr:endolytic transglycosylase MltG [Clostridia bacterium]